MGGAVDEISILLSEADYGHGIFDGSTTHGNVDKLIDKIQKVLAERSGHRKGDAETSAAVSLVEDCFADQDKKYHKEQESRQFELTETFILREQVSGRRRREHARRVEAEEEFRLAGEVALLKGFRESTKQNQGREELQRKISDAERAYFNRKMVVSKASQMASAECRLQFAKVREFFEQLHVLKKDSLSREYQRSLRRLEIIHRLKQSDARVQALDFQIADRVYKKKLQDLNELHIAQSMEEAIYMEQMLDLLDKVQGGKETAAKEIFDLHVQKLKGRQEADTRRGQELANFQADATKQIAQLVATYVHDDKDNESSFQRREEEVDAMERRKGFNGKSRQSCSVGELYDTVLWSVVKNHAGLTSSDSDFSSDFVDEEEEDDEFKLQDNDTLSAGRDEAEGSPEDAEGFCHRGTHRFGDDGSIAGTDHCGDGGSTVGSVGESKRNDSSLSPAGNMHVKQLTRELRMQERDLIKAHKIEDKKERVTHRNAVRALKKKHQNIVDGLIEACLVERQNLRDGIDQHMADLVTGQNVSTEDLLVTIQRDAEVMQEALRAEHKRVEDAETESFTKAQTLISAQVFHEVRNALSSVIAMSEIEYSMKKDTAVSAEQLVSSVEEMLDQIKEVVDYALKMLNNVLDISKITSGTFQVNNHPFDLEELVTKATKMQLAKAGRVKMVFDPCPQPQIACADSDIVVRIVTNLISNSLKFTTSGVVQPFVCPLEDIMGSKKDCEEGMRTVSSSSSLLKLCETGRSDPSISNTAKKLVAVGVADTGSGLSRRKLKFAETAVSNCDTNSGNAHGARNSGFGLHLIHVLAKALGSNLQLTSLEKCRKVLNQDTLNAMNEREKLKTLVQEQGPGSLKSTAIPGKGTVLYITLPVYEDGEVAKKLLQEMSTISLFPSPCSTLPFEDTPISYKFSPRPAAGCVDGCFRIMVADDVPMLRKGIVHALTSIFKDCPVTISTACSAEDLLRAVRQNAFDMVISDNLFHHDASKMKRMESSEEESPGGRPRVFFDGQTSSKKEIRDAISSYFVNERFTVHPGDGEMTGFEAILKLARDDDQVFPTPVLMLLSGNKLEVPPDSGIIVAQKPLKQDDFIRLLENSVPQLLNAGMCSEDSCGTTGSSSSDDTVSISSDGEEDPSCTSVSSTNSTIAVVNCHGTQLFVGTC